MPTFEYFCPTNQRTVEVMHGMADRLSTWAELRERAGLQDDGDTTPSDAPVEKLLGAGLVIQKADRMLGGACDSRPTGGCCGGACNGHG